MLDDAIAGGEFCCPDDPEEMEMDAQKRELLAASEEKLKEKLREVQRHLVERLPAGVSAKKTEGLKEIQSTLKDVEKECRELFNEDLETLEIEYICRLRRVEMVICCGAAYCW